MIARSIEGRVSPERLYNLVLAATESVDEAEEAKAQYQLALLKHGENIDDNAESGSGG